MIIFLETLFGPINIYNENNNICLTYLSHNVSICVFPVKFVINVGHFHVEHFIEHHLHAIITIQLFFVVD